VRERTDARAVNNEVSISSKRPPTTRWPGRHAAICFCIQASLVTETLEPPHVLYRDLGPRQPRFFLQKYIAVLRVFSHESVAVGVVGLTALLFLNPPMMEKVRLVPGQEPRWRNVPSFTNSVFSSSYLSRIEETRVDFPRLFAALLAINFLPAVALWCYEAIRDWLRRHQRKVVMVACMLVLLFLLMAGSAMYERTHRTPPTPSGLDRSSASAVSPSPSTGQTSASRNSGSDPIIF
jgi:hypothetical protein